MSRRGGNRPPARKSRAKFASSARPRARLTLSTANCRNSPELMSTVASPTLPDPQGHFGPYGGRFVPETLMHPLQQLEEEYFRAQHDPEFQRELDYYLRGFCGRPTPLYFAERLTRELGGPKIYLKREDR